MQKLFYEKLSLEKNENTDDMSGQRLSDKLSYKNYSTSYFKHRFDVIFHTRKKEMAKASNFPRISGIFSK